MSETPPSSDSIRAVARILLESQLGRLTELSTQRIREDEPSYAGSPVTPPDLTDLARRTLALALQRLTGDLTDEEFESAAFDTGRRRAEQGFPLVALLHSFRIDLRVLWDAVIAQARLADPETRLAILEQSPLLWEALEANVAEVVDAYRATEDRVSRRVDELNRDAFWDLVAHGESDPEAVSHFAERLLLPENATYTVLVAHDVTNAAEVASEQSATMRRRRQKAYVTSDDERVVGLAVQQQDQEAAVLFAVDEGAGSVTMSARGLSRVPRALRACERVASSRLLTGVLNLDVDWGTALAHLEGDYLDALIDERFASLDTVAPSDLEMLWETMEALLDSDGTIADTAERSFRHRNTIRYRLERFEQITGLNPRRPGDLALIHLAAARRRLRVARRRLRAAQRRSVSQPTDANSR